MIPTVEQKIDELMAQYDEALETQRYERARQLALEMERIIEELKADVITIRTIH